MEFEKDAAITDEQRMLAATKSVTIEPLNAHIVRDEEVGPPTIIEHHPNVERDSENTSVTSTLIQPSQGAFVAEPPRRRNHYIATILILAALVASVVGGATFFIAFG